MKKLIITCMAAVMCICSSACGEDDDRVGGNATVSVTVMNYFDRLLPGTNVYMFQGAKPVSQTDMPSSSRMEKTGSEGIARFDMDLSRKDAQDNQYYFAVFHQSEGESVVISTRGIVLSDGDIVKLDIYLPFDENDVPAIGRAMITGEKGYVRVP